MKEKIVGKQGWGILRSAHVSKMGTNSLLPKIWSYTIAAERIWKNLKFAVDEVHVALL